MLIVKLGGINEEMQLCFETSVSVLGDGCQ